MEDNLSDPYSSIHHNRGVISIGLMIGWTNVQRENMKYMPYSITINPGTTQSLSLVYKAKELIS